MFFSDEFMWSWIIFSFFFWREKGKMTKWLQQKATSTRKKTVAGQCKIGHWISNWLILESRSGKLDGEAASNKENQQVKKKVIGEDGWCHWLAISIRLKLEQVASVLESKKHQRTRWQAFTPKKKNSAALLHNGTMTQRQWETPALWQWETQRRHVRMHHQGH